MSEFDGGGPAFPTPMDVYSGMTLRDWFAGQALAAFSAADADGKARAECLAELAYAAADAMIAEKRRTEGGAE